MYDAVNDPDKPLADEVEKDLDPDKTFVEFSTTALAVMEDVGTCFVTIERQGKIDNEITVKVDTIDGSAEEGDDYIGIHDIFTFEAGQTELEIQIEIVDDEDWEPDEEFFVKVAADPISENKDIKIGKKNIMTVMILNDDDPGTFGFDKRGHFVKVIHLHKSRNHEILGLWLDNFIFKESCGDAVLTVYREDGADGDIDVRLSII